MDSNVISAIISGFFSVLSAFGAVYLKEFLDSRKIKPLESDKQTHPRNVQSSPAVKIQNETSEASDNEEGLDDCIEIAPSEIATPAPAMPDAPAAKTSVPKLGSSKPLLMRPLAIVLGSFLFGLLTRALRPLFTSNTHWESLIALGVLLLLALYLALHHRNKGYALGFQLENVSIWTGWGAGWCLIHGSFWSDLLSVVILSWFICAVVGGFVTKFRKTDAS